MKNEFKAYYQSISDLNLEKIWKDPKTIFVFDTNVLINLYRYKKETVDDFIKLVEALKNRVFIPYHVGLEYHRNRLKPIVENRSEINKVPSELDKCFSQDKLNALMKNRSITKHPELLDLLQEMSNLIDEHRKNICREAKKISDDELHVTAPDHIRESILRIFSGKLGDSPSGQQWLDDLCKEGELRYENNIPPGYKDKDKEGEFRYKGLNYKRKFGDLIIWRQILEYVSSHKDVNNIAFISDDSKEDWRYLVDSQGPKVIGAKLELIEEYLDIRQGSFSVHKSDEFISRGNEVFNLEIMMDSIDDVRSSLAKNMTNSLESYEVSEQVKDIQDQIPQYVKDYMDSDAYKISRKVHKIEHQTPQYIKDYINSDGYKAISKVNDIYSNISKINNHKYPENLHIQRLNNDELNLLLNEKIFLENIISEIEVARLTEEDVLINKRQEVELEHYRDRWRKINSKINELTSRW